MPTKNPRINVSVEKSIYSIIETLAKGKGVFISMVTRDLMWTSHIQDLKIFLPKKQENQY